jgi:hypothetical protein
MMPCIGFGLAKQKEFWGKNFLWPGMVVHACNPSTMEAEAREKKRKIKQQMKAEKPQLLWRAV